MAHEETKRKLEHLSRQIDATLADAKVELERIQRERDFPTPETRRQLAASRCARYWQMPRWLWLPLVLLLVALLVLAIAASGF